MGKDYPSQFNSGKSNLHGFGTNLHIQGPNQYYNPAKTEADSIKECFNKTLYYINRWIRDKMLISLSPLAQKFLVSAPEAFLRNGYLGRRYGVIYPYDTPQMPAYGEIMAAKRSYMPTVYEDVSGKEWYQMSATVEFYKYQNRGNFQDLQEYEEYMNQHTSMVAGAFTRTLNAISKLALAAKVGWTLTTDAFTVPFLNSEAVPTDAESAAAKAFYDTNGKLFKWIKSEIIAQIQEKFTNRVYYIGDLYSPDTDSIEISECSEITIPDNGIDEKTKKLYFKKDGTKMKTPDNMSRFTSLVALVQAMKTTCAALTNITSVANMAFFKPYQKAKQQNSQDADRMDASNATIYMNIFDKIDCEDNVGRTSALGNYTTTLEPLRKMGFDIVGDDSMPPGHFEVDENGWMKLLEVFTSNYHLDFPWYPAEQWGGLLWIKAVISKFVCSVVGVPTKFVPSQFYLTHHYEALKVS